VRELGSGKSRLEMAEVLGINIRVVPNLPRSDGIDAARAFSDKCVVDAKKCESLLNALANYHKEYDEWVKMFRNAPAHDWSSRCADASR
jgi:phage terminase large subunit